MGRVKVEYIYLPQSFALDPYIQSTMQGGPRQPRCRAKISCRCSKMGRRGSRDVQAHKHIGEITNSPWWECEVKKLFHRISTLVAKESTFLLAGQPTGISITGCRLLEPPFIISYGWNWCFLLPYPLEIGYDGGLMQTARTNIYPLPTLSTQLAGP